MEWSFVFFLNSVLLGVGLAMDAFSVSMANGLHDPKMNKGTMCKIAGTFALFQAAMPMIGWVCVHTIVELFSSFETLIPWIALALLGYIGGKMLMDGIHGEEAEEAAELSAGALFMQGVATSIDALSVGFTISEYGWLMALTAAIIIAVVTFILCMAGLRSSRWNGNRHGRLVRLCRKAPVPRTKAAPAGTPALRLRRGIHRIAGLQVRLTVGRKEPDDLVQRYDYPRISTSHALGRRREAEAHHCKNG